MKPSSEPGGVIRPWQAVLLGLALASLTAFVLAPVLAALWVGVSIVAAAIAVVPFADLVRSDRFLLGGAVHLAGAVLLIPATIEAVRQIRHQLLLAQGSSPSPLPWWRGTWPVVIAGLAFVDVVLVPVDRWVRLGVPRAALAAALLAGVVVAIGLSLRAAWWAGIAAVRGTWRLGRRSPMLTGALVASAVLVPALGYANFALLDAVARSSVRPVGQHATQLCERPGMDSLCGLRGEARTSAAGLQAGVLPDANAPVREDHREMAACIELLHAPDFERGYSYGDIVNRATNVLRNRDDAYDVVQQTLLAVCLRHEQRPIEELHAYFARSVLNRARSTRSRRWCSIPVDDEAPLRCPAPSPEEQAIYDERVRAVENAYCNLELNDAMVIQLRDFDGLEYSALAQRLASTEAAVRQRHSRALRALAEGFRRQCR